MGHHILPQYYLRGFAQPGKEELWMYDKGKEHPLFLPIKGIAKENKLYGKYESYLAEEIEKPANDVLRKVRNREPVSVDEKNALSKYMFVFAKRVPAAFKRFQDNAPIIAKDHIDELDRGLREYETRNPDKASQCDFVRKNAQRVMTDLAENPTKEVWVGAIPVSNENVPELLTQMTWTFYVCKDLDIFITSDNPVFIHRRIGVRPKNADMSFPISKNISLLASWQGLRDQQHSEATSQEIKELNRRTVHNATRFVYSPEEKDWIMALLNKKAHQIHLWALLSSRPTRR
ncbi:MAG: DUF4238 domain-containing protein [Deltaproteobacteria bacterium]|nr:DUF4238 domain-containing protein [Deltaproteobacteria bacterium]